MIDKRVTSDIIGYETEIIEDDKILIELKLTDCFHCVFLNSSDTGENCNILRKGIQEEEWSNISFQFKEGWRYEKCPLFHDGYICRNCGVSVIK